MTEVVLKVANQKYEGWQSVRVNRSIDTVSGSFSLSVTDRWDINKEPRPIRTGDACEVSINNQVLINGHIDEVSISYDAGSHSISVSGRDKTGDLVDCAAVHEKGEVIEPDLASLAKVLCDPYGIDIVNHQGKLSLGKSVSFDDGETIFEVIERYARRHGVLLLSTNDGNLSITEPSNETLPLSNGQGRSAAITFGHNVLSCDYSQSLRDRFNVYLVKGQNADPEASSAITLSQLKGEAQDSFVRTPRTHILAIDANSPDDCNNRALWERNIRAARGVRLNYTLQGWEYEPGRIWQENRMATVNDPFIGIENTQFLIVAIEYAKDSSGSKTNITLAPREAYTREPLSEMEAV